VEKDIKKKKNPPGGEIIQREKTVSVFGRRNSKGFTLVEILVTVCLLTIALLGLVSLTNMVIKANSFSKMITTATTLANDKMEQLKTSGYDSSSGGPETIRSIYTRSWTITGDGSPAVGMKTIVVTVQWSWLGTLRNVALKTIVAR
jgi:type IV pilus assembly protein PilV